MATVNLRKVNRVFADHHAVRDLDLDVEDGEFVVVVGPSGCGKTTMLRMIAGLEEISSGEVLIDGEVVNHLEPQRRDVAMVFQEYALYPQMTVFDNIAFGLKLRRMASSEIRRRVSEIAEILDIADLLVRKPRALSGGQRQRVAMGRALVREPKVFLMDEPLSNLDAKLRVHMRYEVARIQRELGTTTVFVTHDQVEAMTMGSRVAVMHAGRLLQVDTPQQLYDKPANVLVGAFIGSPEMNLLRAAIERDEESRLACRVGSQRLPLPEVAARKLSASGRVAEGELILGLRPEALEDGSLPIVGNHRARLRGVVEAVEILGAERVAHVRVEGASIVTAEVLETVTSEEEKAAGGGRRPADLIVGRFDGSSRASAGDAVEIAVDMTNAHVFDPATGLPIG